MGKHESESVHILVMGSSRQSGGTLPRGHFGGFLSHDPKIILGKVLVYKVLVCD